MGYTITLYDDLPILQTYWDSSFVFKTDSDAFSDDVRKTLDSLKTPVYYVLDVKVWQDVLHEDLIKASDMAARHGNSNFHHPMTEGVIVVTTHDLVKLAVEGLRDEIYGSLNIGSVDSVEDAIEFIRNQ